MQINHLVLGLVLGLGISRGGLAETQGAQGARGTEGAQRPNIVFVMADQWRAQATGYAGDPNVKTPNLDRLATQGINMVNAVSGCPLCTPYRGTLFTGQYPLKTGLFINDVPLNPKGATLGETFRSAGYSTAYIGKWHVNGGARSAYIPPERRFGFETFKVLECTHDYNNSRYYDGNDPTLRTWKGYDAIAQTDAAIDCIKNRKPGQPLLLMLSWGAPHDPYDTAPQKYHDLYSAEKIKLRPNVPEGAAKVAQGYLANYYAHCTALDDCMGDLIKALDKEGLAENTIVVFTADHGDMLKSQNQIHKQRPWDESIRVPFLIRYPAKLGHAGKNLNGMFETADIMPTLLGLSGLSIPGSVEGKDFSKYLLGQGTDPSGGAAVVASYQPIADWSTEYRGVRTPRYTYAKKLDGPWLLFDNEKDPYQLTNLIGKPEAAEIQKQLDAELAQRLKERGDQFLPGAEYLKQWGYRPNPRSRTVQKNKTQESAPE